MIGFIILLVVALLVGVVYLVFRGTGAIPDSGREESSDNT
jgi:hypothetical protein